MRTNAWIALELSIAQAWWAYYQWVLGGQEGTEPPLDNFGKNAIRRLVDLDFSFQCFKKATIGAQDFRMLSVFDVTEAQLNLGYTQYGNAEEGGGYAVVGLWTWVAGDPLCLLDDSFNWRPAQVLKFMPDECADPECATTVPASEVWDVALLAGQPPRVLPIEALIR